TAHASASRARHAEVSWTTPSTRWTSAAQVARSPSCSMALRTSLPRMPPLAKAPSGWVVTTMRSVSTTSTFGPWELPGDCRPVSAGAEIQLATLPEAGPHLGRQYLDDIGPKRRENGQVDKATRRSGQREEGDRTQRQFAHCQHGE